ncbi:MAG: DUF1127 domain-containing protein [Betaproteobacteria bacterium]
MERIHAIELPQPLGASGNRRLAALAAALAGALSSACDTVAAWAQARGKAATRRELHGLSDHTLRDIGLHRSQIDGLFR